MYVTSVDSRLCTQASAASPSLPLGSILTFRFFLPQAELSRSHRGVFCYRWFACVTVAEHINFFYHNVCHIMLQMLYEAYLAEEQRSVLPLFHHHTGGNVCTYKTCPVPLRWDKQSLTRKKHWGLWFFCEQGAFYRLYIFLCSSIITVFTADGAGLTPCSPAGGATELH